MITDFPKNGIIAALYLPFDGNGELLKTPLEHHIKWLQEKGVHGLLALGSSGNFPFLNLQQRLRVLETVREISEQMPVIANVSDIHPSKAIDLATYADTLNMAGIALMPPSFYSSSDEDQLAHFLQISNSVPNLPLLLYNFPELAGNRITLSTVTSVAEQANLKGFKQSGNEFSYHKSLIALANEKHFSVFSGSDTRLPEVFKMGANGCIGGLVNFVPELMLDIYDASFSENTTSNAQSSISAERLKKVGKILQKLSFPLNLSAAMEARGFECGHPFPARSNAAIEAHKRIVLELRACFREWKLPLFHP